MPDFEVTAPDGRTFIVTAPEGATQADVLAYAKQNMSQLAAPERSAGERVARGVGLAGKGFNDAIGSAIGMLPDAVGSGLRLFGLPSSEPGQYTRWAQGALNALGRNDTPETTAEKAIYGAARGVGDVAGMMAPAGMVSAASKAGGLARGVAQTMLASPGLQLASGAVGGAVGEATDSPVAGFAAGMAVPLAVGGARLAVSPGGARVSEESRRLVDVARAEGIPLTPGQVTGSRPLRATESVFATLPSTAGRQAALDQTQREAFNRAALGRAGVRGENLATPDVLNTARERIGGEIGEIAQRNTMQLTPGVLADVQQVANDARRYLPSDKAKPVLSRVADLLDKVDGKTFQVEGAAYAKLDSALGAQIRGEADGNVRNTLQSLRDALRAGMDASISGDDAAAWQRARRDYANLMMITRAMNAPNVNTAAGNIPPAALSTAVAAGPQRNFAMGRGDLNDLSRVGRAFIQDTVPNSGTPERLAIQNMLTGGALGGGALYGGASPLSALGLTAAALAGPRVAQAAYYSPLMQNYLTNQLAERALPRVTGGALRAVAAGQARGLLD